MFTHKALTVKTSLKASLVLLVALDCSQGSNYRMPSEESHQSRWNTLPTVISPLPKKMTPVIQSTMHAS